MQGGLIPFSELESNKPIAQIQGWAQKPSRGAVTHNLLSGRDKGRDRRTPPRDGTYAPHQRQRQEELLRVTCESLRSKNQRHSCLCSPSAPVLRRVCYSGAIATSPDMFRLLSYRGLLKITYPLLQHCLKHNGLLNPHFPGSQESFSLRSSWLAICAAEFLLFSNPLSWRLWKPGWTETLTVAQPASAVTPETLFLFGCFTARRASAYAQL